MAVAHSQSWFWQWHPPSDFIPKEFDTRRELAEEPVFHRDYHYSEENDKGRSNNAAFALPFLLSLSVLRGTDSQSGAASVHKGPLVVGPSLSEHYDQYFDRHDFSKPFYHHGQDHDSSGPLKLIYHWNQLDFEYPSDSYRDLAIANGDFIVENNLPLGLDAWKDRIFITMPRWKNGVPVTLATVPRIPRETSPKLEPYPSWDWHDLNGGCDGLTSVFRVHIDECGRIWILDSGQIEVTLGPKPVCPPTIYIFDLETDLLLMRYVLPKDFVKQDGLFSNIVVDIRDGKCDEAFAYLTDVWRFGLVVFDLEHVHSWRITHGYFYPDPLFSRYQIDDLVFRWTDGLFGLALSPVDVYSGDRILFFHPMSSSQEFYVKTSTIRNETTWKQHEGDFKVLGPSRSRNGHASASWMDRNGILFLNMVTRNAVQCWDLRKPYRASTLGYVQQDNETLVFPNDIKIDHEPRQSLYVLTNRLPFYLYRKLDPNNINFRVFTAFTDDAVKGTICDPDVPYASHSADDYEGECPPWNIWNVF